MTKRLITAALLLSGATFCAVAQDTPDSFSIHVESNQVLVPTYVFYKDRMGELSPTELGCIGTSNASYFKLLPDQAYTSTDCDEAVGEKSPLHSLTSDRQSSVIEVAS